MQAPMAKLKHQQVPVLLLIIILPQKGSLIRALIAKDLK
jgi:hypothetical protein